MAKGQFPQGGQGAVPTGQPCGCPAEGEGPPGAPYAGFGGFHGPGENKTTKKKEGKERVEKGREALTMFSERPG